MGGVVGLSLAGLSVLPLSSVMPGPLPVPETSGFDPEATASMLADAVCGAAGEDVDCASLVLNRALFRGGDADGS